MIFLELRKFFLCLLSTIFSRLSSNIRLHPANCSAKFPISFTDVHRSAKFLTPTTDVHRSAKSQTSSLIDILYTPLSPVSFPKVSYLNRFSPLAKVGTGQLCSNDNVCMCLLMFRGRVVGLFNERMKKIKIMKK